MLKNKMVLICLTLFLCLILVSCSVSTNTAEVEEKSKQFIEDLMKYNLDNAKDQSLGGIQFNIATMDTSNMPNIDITSIDTNILNIDQNHAIIHATVEFLEDNKTFNTQFYEIKLIKKDDNEEWKIYHLKPSDPLFNNKSVSTNNNTSFTTIMKDFLVTMDKNVDVATKEFLIGTARTMQEQSNMIITQEQNKLLNANLEIKNSKTIYEDENNQLIVFNIKNQDREVNILTHFYLTQGMGWRICNVQQL